MMAARDYPTTYTCFFCNTVVKHQHLIRWERIPTWMPLDFFKDFDLENIYSHNNIWWWNTCTRCILSQHRNYAFCCTGCFTFGEGFCKKRMIVDADILDKEVFERKRASNALEPLPWALYPNIKDMERSKRTVERSSSSYSSTTTTPSRSRSRRRREGGNGKGSGSSKSQPMWHITANVAAARAAAREVVQPTPELWR